MYAPIIQVLVLLSLIILLLLLAAAVAVNYHKHANWPNILQRCDRSIRSIHIDSKKIHFLACGIIRQPGSQQCKRVRGSESNSSTGTLTPVRQFCISSRHFFLNGSYGSAGRYRFHLTLHFNFIFGLPSHTNFMNTNWWHYSFGHRHRIYHAQKFPAVCVFEIITQNCPNTLVHSMI